MREKAQLYGWCRTLMRKPVTRDDYWYNRLSDIEPKKIYRRCPRCNSKVGIPEYYPTKFCYMCGETIYVDEKKNEEVRKKYAFIRKMEQKGLKLNAKKTTRRKKVSKEV